MIILIRINSEQTMCNPPLGLLYVGDALKKAGYEVRLYHICENRIHDYIREIAEMKPIWVGFSVNTGWSMKAALEMSREIKKSIQVPVVWGNAHPTFMPEQCLSEQAIDFLVMGEGEVTAVELSKTIVAGKGYELVKGIGYRDSLGNIRVNEPRDLIKNLDQYEIDWSLLDPERYVFSAPQFGMKRAFQFITSRGCPHKCTFCFNQNFNRGKWRSHSEEYVLDKVLALKNSLSLDGIRFWDDNLFSNKKRAFSILKKIHLPYTAEVRVDYIDEEFARQLHETKCKMVLFGFESGSDRILNVMGKGSTKQDNMKALKILGKYKDISIHPSFIVGCPSETEDDYKKTLEQFSSMIMMNPNFWFIRLGLYVPYPGCELYRMAVENGFAPPSTTEEWDNLIWDTSSEKSVTCVDWLKGKKDLAKDEEHLIMLYDMIKSRIPFMLLPYLVRKRIRKRFYRFPIEKGIYVIIRYIINGLRINQEAV
jgi:anaerobic magnesium-protoporphyrin IX monomethyl ester cyclase